MKRFNLALFVFGCFFMMLFFFHHEQRSIFRSNRRIRFFTLTVNKPLKYIKPIVTAELVTYTLCGFFLIKAQFNANNLFNHPLRYHK